MRRIPEKNINCTLEIGQPIGMGYKFRIAVTYSIYQQYEHILLALETGSNTVLRTEKLHVTT